MKRLCTVPAVFSCLLLVPIFAHAQGAFTITAIESIGQTATAEIHVRIFDDRATDATPLSLPVRAIVTTADGSYLDASGHGLYKDGRFFADGAFTIHASPGATTFHLASGPNYVPLEFIIDAQPGTRYQVVARLHQGLSPESRGWYSGDNHVHAQHDDTAEVKSGLAYTALQGRANGLSFITESGSNVAYDDLDSQSTEGFLLRYAAEQRPGSYAGHVNTPGIRAPIAESLRDAIMRAPLPVQAVTRAAHELGGVAIHTHPMTPPFQLHWMGAAEAYSNAVLGTCTDLFDIDARHTELLWFAILNLGNKVGASSYTDAALGRTNTLSPGDRRVYCRAEAFTYPALVDAMRLGRTVATNGGPIFPFFTIDGEEPGATFAAEAGKTRQAHLEVQALRPYESAVLYRNGNIVKNFHTRGQRGTLELSHDFEEKESAWYVARVEDDQGKWAITSPIYFDAPAANTEDDTPKASVLLEINNCIRYIELRREFFAHLILTVSPEDRLTEVVLHKDGAALQTFSPAEGNHLADGKTPVTGLEGAYAPGWQWHPDANTAHHFQADWPVTESGWYSVEATTANGRHLRSEALRFDAANAASHQLSTVRMTGPGTTFILHGYSEEMPLADIQVPFEGDHWWYPKNTYWQLTATFDGQEHTRGGGNTDHAKRFQALSSD